MPKFKKKVVKIVKAVKKQIIRIIPQPLIISKPMPNIKVDPEPINKIDTKQEIWDMPNKHLKPMK